MACRIRSKSHVIVIDLGACQCRAGFAGEDAPRATFSTIVGAARHIDPALGGNGRDFVVGSDVYKSCDASTLYSPFKNGLIQTKTDYEKLFRHIFEEELHVDSERRAIVISEPINNPLDNRKNIAEALFETFRVPSFYLGTAPALALFTSCKTGGVAFDCGDSFSQVSSVFEWTQMTQSLLRTPLAGRAVTRYTQKCFKDASYHFTGPNGPQIAQKIKETHGFIATDYTEVLTQQADTQIDYDLGQDAKIQVTTQRFRCPELLFQPKLDGLAVYNVAELLFESVMRCDVGLRPSLWANVVLAGGTTLFTGFDDRLKKELMALAPGVEINIVSDTNRATATWVGGSIVGGLELFGQMVVTRQEYHESGPLALRRRFY
jgi:actin-related protein